MTRSPDKGADHESSEDERIKLQEIVAVSALAEIGDELQKQGLSLDEMIERGRTIRGHLLREQYGIIDPTPGEAFDRQCLLSIASSSLTSTSNLLLVAIRGRRSFVPAGDMMTEPETLDVGTVGINFLDAPASLPS